MTKSSICFCFLIITYNILFSQSIGIIPEPQKIIHEGNNSFFKWNSNVLIHFYNNYNEDDAFTITQIQEYTNKHAGFINKQITNNQKIKDNDFYIDFIISDLPEIKQNKEQAYIIKITPSSIFVYANSSTGFFYAAQSLKQLFLFNKDNKNNFSTIPCMTIIDYPAIKYRGWLDDISRGPIPTVSYLKQVISKFAEYKLNFFNLYTEHCFKSNNYPDISPADGLTAQEIEELSLFASNYHISMFGNQQCLAHAEKILHNPFYSNLADTRYNFNPGLEDTYTFLETILSEEAKAYKSTFFNINCDETEGLGSGLAKKYVDSIGNINAYCKHINRINSFLKKYNKKVMMWGDIAYKDTSIINKLSKDITIIAWSYVAADNFNDLIYPFKKTGFDFFIAPGTSMWATAFPSIKTYIKNIAYFVRDGHKNSSLGMMNTAWDDAGESMFNNVWHSMIWSAEMSWKPLEQTKKEEAEIECKNRENNFNKIFSKQLFDKQGDSIMKLIYTLDQYADDEVKGIMEFGSINENLFNFYPANIDENYFNSNNKLYTKTLTLVNEFNYFANNSHDEQAKTIINNAKLAALRLICTCKKNMLRIQIYNSLNSPTNNNINTCKSEAKTLLKLLYEFKILYSQLWDKENRAYWRDFILTKYDALANELLNIEQQVFINLDINKENKREVSLKTLYNDKQIFYTIDGSTPNKYSNLYVKPFEISQSCNIKTVTFNSFKEAFYNEKYILIHKAISKLKKLNSKYSTYNAAYSGGGNDALVDGVLGSDNFKDGKWQGFQGQDLDIEIDLQQINEIKRISTRFLQHTYNWILSPKIIEIYYSKDGETYQLAKKHITEVDWKAENQIYTISINDINLKTRYIKFIAKYPGHLPEWHHAKNNPSYMFADEIVVE